MRLLEEEEGVVDGGATLLENLKKLTIQCGDGRSSYREDLDPVLFLDAAFILRKRIVLTDGNVQSIVEEALPILTQTLRFLRNAVAGCKINQDFIREKTNIIETCEYIFNHVTRVVENEGDSNANALEGNQVLARCTIQFLMNLMVDNVDNARLLSSSTTISSMSELLKITRDEKIIQYAAMNFHTLLQLIPDAESAFENEIIPVMLANTHLEFVMYFIETLATNDGFMIQRKDLKVEDRVKLIRVIVAHTELHGRFPLKIVTFLSDQFKQKSDLIFKSRLENDDWIAWEIASLLELLCCLSALDEISLKTDSSLLTTAIFLLKSVHSAGKAINGNESATTFDFSPVTDIEAMKISSDTEEMRSQPTFQFKAHLIRLIANLTHCNFEHQEMVRETQVLPVILDSCKIDARNPFITQWAVLAVRNACEGNPTNQEIVRSVQQIDTKDTLSGSKIQLIGL